MTERYPSMEATAWGRRPRRGDAYHLLADAIIFAQPRYVDRKLGEHRNILEAIAAWRPRHRRRSHTPPPPHGPHRSPSSSANDIPHTSPRTLTQPFGMLGVDIFVTRVLNYRARLPVPSVKRGTSHEHHS